MQPKKGILLVNLGTPKSPKAWDVFRYLNEFLTDGRVIDIPWLPRQLLVRGVITPFRSKASARAYQEIWTKEGSPLLVYGKRVKELLQNRLGSEYLVELAMRYQEPSIQKGLENLKQVDELVVLPLFPQYASATTGSIFEKVMEVVSTWRTIPKLKFVHSYPEEKKMIEAFAERMRVFPIEEYDQILFSFHGLPKRHVEKSSGNGYCFSTSECCNTLCVKNQHCYSAQCYATARAIAKRLNLQNYAVSFQSRLGKDPWLEPYTSETLRNCLEEEKKSVLVACPAFICDCLETLYEIGIEEKEIFLEGGGEKLDLVTGLNDHPLWIEAIEDLVVGQQSVLSGA